MKPPPPLVQRPARSSEAGFTIIEVLVAALILAIVSAGGAVAFVGAVGTSGIQRNRSAAEALAQRDESRLRGYTVNQLANLNQTLSPVTIDGTAYTVKEAATFVSDSSGTPSCVNPSADYLETSSTVTWSGMPADLHGVTVNGLLTPTGNQISSGAGVLAVQVENPGGTPYVGMPVSATQVGGTGSASGITAANGCVLFADLPVGNYSVSVAPASGAYVDAGTNASVSSNSRDTTTATVASGTTAANAVTVALATPGAASFSFTDLWPAGVSPAAAYAPIATSPSVVLASGSLSTPSTIICSPQDTSGCPSVLGADSSWTSSAWTTTNNGTWTAMPLAPYTYAAYAGICSSDEPALPTFGATDASTAVTSGATTGTTLALPSIVVRLYGGTGVPGILGALLPLSPLAGSEQALPSGSKLVITDTGCAEHYVGGPSVAVPSGDSYLPINPSPQLTGGANDTGLLGTPGMPYGSYTVCYQNGSKDTQVTLPNKGSGEIVDLYNGSLATGTCAT